MCDYSLETYQSRPARKGEQYVLHRFPSGSKGFVSPGKCDTAVCIPHDTPLHLENIVDSHEELRGIGVEADVTFVALDTHPYKDGVRLADGTELSVQRLPLGTTASIAEPAERKLPLFQMAEFMA